MSRINRERLNSGRGQVDYPDWTEPSAIVGEFNHIVTLIPPLFAPDRTEPIRPVLALPMAYKATSVLVLSVLVNRMKRRAAWWGSGRLRPMGCGKFSLLLETD